jgi:hypothetical protein
LVDLLRYNRKIRYRTQGSGWSNKKESVVKDDGASEHYVGRKFIDELTCQGPALLANDAGWMILERININAEDGIEKCQRVKLKIQLSVSCVYELEFTI